MIVAKTGQSFLPNHIFDFKQLFGLENQMKRQNMTTEGKENLKEMLASAVLGC